MDSLETIKVQRAKDIINFLKMESHPEGGYYIQIHESNLNIIVKDTEAQRRASTHIYFLLIKGQVSRWHKLKSEEFWNYYEGDPLEIKWIDNTGNEHTEILGKFDMNSKPFVVIPKNCWQSAKPLGQFTFIGCTVAPGFEWKDFEILGDKFTHPSELITKQCLPRRGLLINPLQDIRMDGYWANIPQLYCLNRILFLQQDHQMITFQCFFGHKIGKVKNYKLFLLLCIAYQKHLFVLI